MSNQLFNEKKGKKYIHKRYKQWTRSLADTISTNLGLGSKYVPAAAGNSLDNKPPKEAFSAFGKYILEDVTLAAEYQNIALNNGTVRNLKHNLDVNLGPRIRLWEEDASSERTLIIKTNIEKVKFIGANVRIWAGAFAGKSWITTKISFVDQASGELVGESVLHRVAAIGSGWTPARADYKMIEDMSNDIKQYVINNYLKPVGGGAYPPKKFR
ncbi:MAG: hypothetical protein COA42_16415 [Alteromonadaceae bacterium]|nr:MAG: hypothetical protein COA42_16415 [Alteromonadaceae bacterium]